MGESQGPVNRRTHKLPTGPHWKALWVNLRTAAETGRDLIDIFKASHPCRIIGT